MDQILLLKNLIQITRIIFNFINTLILQIEARNINKVNFNLLIKKTISKHNSSVLKEFNFLKINIIPPTFFLQHHILSNHVSPHTGSSSKPMTFVPIICKHYTHWLRTPIIQIIYQNCLNKQPLNNICYAFFFTTESHLYT